tara:strand:+ start:657 stop:1049 length:393 start_codon:yes stop_codon:yes gene_type:complete
MENKPLIPIGSKIKVDKSRIKDILPKKLLDNTPQIINAEVVDYKMTDGMEIGYVLETETNLKLWIFKNELNEQTKKEYNIDDTNINLNTKELISRKLKVSYDINGNKNIKTLSNPINLINWIIFTLKDIL